MKNKNIISLESEVPVEIRLKVYRRAIRLMNKGENVAKLETYGLCLLLPSIMWDLDYYCDMTPSGEIWRFADTGIAFPELTADVIDTIEREYSTREKNKLRKSYLQSFVKQLKSN